MSDIVNERLLVSLSNVKDPDSLVELIGLRKRLGMDGQYREVFEQVLAYYKAKKTLPCLSELTLDISLSTKPDPDIDRLIENELRISRDRLARQILIEQSGENIIDLEKIREAKALLSPTASTDKRTESEDLRGMRFPKFKYLVDQLVHDRGLFFLAGKQKTRKSMMVLNVAKAICSGEPALGDLQVIQGSVLLIALEDGLRRIKWRLLQMGGVPDGLYIHTAYPPIGSGGLRKLDAEVSELKEASDLRLVVIDVFGRFQPDKVVKPSDRYGFDYRNVTALKEIADRHGVTILCVHHVSKQEYQQASDGLYGSRGITAGADGTWVLKKADQETYQGTITLESRDLADRELALAFDDETLSWSVVGELEATKHTEKQMTLIRALTQAKEPLSPKELSDLTELDRGYVKMTLFNMAKAGTVEKVGKGKYQIPSPEDQGEHDHLIE